MVGVSEVLEELEKVAVGKVFFIFSSIPTLGCGIKSTYSN